MAKFSIDKTTIGEIINTPELTAIAEKLVPGITKKPGIKMAAKMSLKDAALFVPKVLTPEILKKAEEEFAKLG